MPAPRRWSHPSPKALGGESEPQNGWMTGRVARQIAAPKIMARLRALLAQALGEPQDSPLVTAAIADLAIGFTIEIDGSRYSLISPTSLAIADPAGEAVFERLDQ